MKRIFQITFLLLYWFSFSAQLCTKELVYGRDFYTDPVHETFDNDRISVMAASQKVLENLGYEIQVTDESKGELITGWRPVEAESHYLKLFERPDYGAADGAYYQLTVDLTDVNSRMKVAVGTKVKTIVGKLDSSKKVERRFLDQLRDQLRPSLIELTNVGVRKK